MHDPCRITDALWRAMVKTLMENPNRIELASAYGAPEVHRRGTLIRPSGRHLYGAMLAQSQALINPNDYYPHRVENNIIEHNKFLIKGRCVIDLGSADGEQMARLARENGMPARYIPVDIVSGYLQDAFDTMVALHMDNYRIASILGDFFTEETLKKIEKEIQTARQQGIPVTILWLGNTALNFPLEQTMALIKNIRALLLPGDIFYLGGDSTLHDETLLRGYDALAEWLKNGIASDFDTVLRLYNKKTGAAGIDINQLDFVQTVTATAVGNGRTVNFDIFNKAKQELFLRLPFKNKEQMLQLLDRVPEDNRDVAVDILTQMITKPFIFNEGKINMDGSSRYPEDFYRILARDTGYSILRREGVAEGEPLRPVNSNENRHVNDNIWPFEPALAA